MDDTKPLSGIRVLELAGLAPGPFAGLFLADYGASVLRVDRPNSGTSAPAPATDLLTRGKASIVVNLKTKAGLLFFRELVKLADVLIDPFRPGVLENLGLGPKELLALNDRLIFARLTGFRRDGKYANIAGHDISYLAVSGILSMLGRHGEPPYAPANLLGDFAGGGAMCFIGILLALYNRLSTGKGQVVETNMVDGISYLGSFLRYARKTPIWSEERGRNLLDGGCPYYDIYETKDGKYMAVGALEEKFFRMLVEGLGMPADSFQRDRKNPSEWPNMRELFKSRFKTKTRNEWATIYDKKDACCTPVLDNNDLEAEGYEHRLPVHLQDSKDVNKRDFQKPFGKDETFGRLLSAGEGGASVLEEWSRFTQKRLKYLIQPDGSYTLQETPRL